MFKENFFSYQNVWEEIHIVFLMKIDFQNFRVQMILVYLKLELEVNLCLWILDNPFISSSNN